MNRYYEEDLPYTIAPPTLVSSKAPNAVRRPCIPPPANEGRKDDGEKLRLDLLTPEALTGIAQVLGFGAAKYGDRNWEAGIKYSRVYAAALRHLLAWFAGEDVDHETGLSHLDHAQCCLHFLSTYVHRGYDHFDDRPARS